MNLINITIPETPISNYNLLRAKCDLYEQIENSEEGICFPTQRVVSIRAGCNCPENCYDKKRYLNLIGK